MEMGSKPCQDGFLSPILVQCRKNKKVQVDKWGTTLNKYSFHVPKGREIGEIYSPFLLPTKERALRKGDKMFHNRSILRPIQ